MHVYACIIDTYVQMCKYTNVRTPYLHTYINISIKYVFY